MPARVGLHLGAVDGDGAQLDQTHLAGQANDLHEQVAEFLQAQRAEVADRAMRGEVARAQHPEGYVLVQLACDLARAEHTSGVAIQQHLDHHRRVERLIARAVLLVARVECAQVEPVHRVVDEVRQVPFGQPFLHRFGQQHHLLRVVRKVVRGHAATTPPAHPSSSGTTLRRQPGRGGARVMLAGASLWEGGWREPSNMLELPRGGGSGELCIIR